MSDLDETTNIVAEHISNINAGLKLEERDQTCHKLHGDVARAVVWILRKLEGVLKEMICARRERGYRTLKIPGGFEIPIEKGLSFRDLLALIFACAFVYYILREHGLL